MQPVCSVLPAHNKVLQILLLSISIKTQLARSWLLSSYGFRILSWKFRSSGRSWLLLFGFFELSAVCFVVFNAGWGLVGVDSRSAPSESAGTPTWPVTLNTFLLCIKQLILSCPVNVMRITKGERAAHDWTHVSLCLSGSVLLEILRTAALLAPWSDSERISRKIQNMWSLHERLRAFHQRRAKAANVYLALKSTET